MFRSILKISGSCSRSVWYNYTYYPHGNCSINSAPAMESEGSFPWASWVTGIQYTRRSIVMLTSYVRHKSFRTKTFSAFLVSSTFRNITIFYVEGPLACHSTPKMDDHPLTAVRDCLFNTFAASLHPQPEDARCHGDKGPTIVRVFRM
jgi:hypothetical protein